MTDTQTVANELTRVIEDAAIEWRSITNAAAAAKPTPGKWSIKEIAGHLIDSAANNHQRFVRAQYAGGTLVLPGYAQNEWVELQAYQDRPWPELIELWLLYNRHLAHVIRTMPISAAARPCKIGNDDAVSLGFLVEDYVDHMRKHLRQIQERRSDVV